MLSRILVLSALLTVAGLAQATEFGPEDHDGMKRPSATHQNLSKRPYAAPVVKVESFEGTVVSDTVTEQPKRLKLHMLDRRPYMEKAAD